MLQDELVILAFPCNQFGGQEPGSWEEISSFAQSRFGVTFPILGKVGRGGGIGWDELRSENR